MLCSKKIGKQDAQCYCNSKDGAGDVACLLGWLKTQIGKRVLVSFLLGTNTFQDRTGTLQSVGINYITLIEEGGTITACNAQDIKFVRVYND
jgi:hypothetical protein